MNRRKKKVSEKLGAYVRKRYTASTEARKELFDQLRDCVRLMEGDHEPDVDGVDVDVNIIAPIVRGVKSLLRDVLGNTADEPYTIGPTPLADLPQDVERRLAEGIQRNMPQLMAVLQSPAEFETFLNAARNSAVLAVNREAVKRGRKMEVKVKDEMRDADWAGAFDDFCHNFVIYPYAVMKSPSPQTRPWKEWINNRMVVRERIVDMVENISPFDFGWAPNSLTVQSAEYLWERRRIGADQLLDYAQDESYDADAIDYIFEQMPQGHIEPYDDGGEEPAVLEELEAAVTTANTINVDEGYYDAIGLYGRIKGEYLKEFGIDVEDPRRWYEAVVWTINDITFSVALNPDPMGQRPFHVASYDAKPGQIAGESPVMKLRDTQRMCRASVRALTRNMALASGVVGEVQADRVADDDDPRQIQAHTLRLVNAARSGQAGSAYQFHNIDSHAAELMAIFDRFHALAYDMLGIPRMAFGSTDGLGTIGRTSGGLSMVLNQASKTLKDSLRTLETKVIVPVVQGYIDRINLYGTDNSMKGDVRVYARGVSGILEREGQREKLTWALQSIAPLVSTGTIPNEAVMRLVYAMFQANGVETAGIFPDFDSQDAGGEDLAALGAAGVPQAEAPSALALPGGEVTLDGRSANAVAAIENSNSLGG